MGNCPLYTVCILCAYYCTVHTVHIIVQFTLYTAHCTLYNVPLWSPVGGVHITLYTVHCIDALHIVQFTLYLQIYLLVHCPCTSVHLCTCALYLYLTSGTCTSLKVPHSRYLTQVPAAPWCLQVPGQYVYSLGDCSTSSDNSSCRYYPGWSSASQQSCFPSYWGPALSHTVHQCTLYTVHCT